MVALAAAAAITGACVSPADERVGVGSWKPEAIVPAPDPVLGAINPDKPDEPSVSGLDRSSWASYTVVVEREPVRHYPIYRSDPAYTSALARQRGDFPTIETALDTTNPDALRQQAAEGVAFQLWAALDIPLMVPRFFIQPPMKLTTSPTDEKPRFSQPNSPASTPSSQP